LAPGCLLTGKGYGYNPPYQSQPLICTKGHCIKNSKGNVSWNNNNDNDRPI